MEEKSLQTTTIRLTPIDQEQPKLIVGKDGHTKRIMELTDLGLVDYVLTEDMTTHKVKLEITPRKELYAESEGKALAPSGERVGG